MKTFYEYLVLVESDESDIQISRLEMWEITRRVPHLIMNYGVLCRPGVDISKGGFGVETTDPERLVRILGWGLDKVKEFISSYPYVKNATLKKEDYVKGKHDQDFVPILRRLNHLIPSLLYNFKQVNYDHEPTNIIGKMLEKYKSLGYEK